MSQIVASRRRRTGAAHSGRGASRQSAAIPPSMRRTGVALSVVLAAGCSVGPDYERPDLAERTAAAWREASGAEVGAERADLARWWERFGSPELSELATRLLAQNLSLAEARQRVVTARAQRGIVAADRLPQVGAGAGYTRAGTGDDSLNFQGPPPGQDVDVYSASVAAAWEIDLWGRVGRLVEAADAEIEVTIEDYRDAAVSLLSELALAYVDARILRERLEVVDRNIALQRETLRLAQSRLDAGSGARLDVEQARRELETSRAAVPELERALAVAENRVAVLAGERPRDGLVASRDDLVASRDDLVASRDDLVAAEDDLVASEDDLVAAGDELVLPDTVGRGVPADLLSRRADVRRSERRLAAAVARIGAAEAERYPSISISGTLALRAQDLDVLAGGADALSYSVGPNLTIPLYTGGRIDSRVATRESQADAARIGFERALLEAIAEVENAAVGVVRTRERLARLDAAAAASRTAVDLARELYDAGSRGLLQVLDAQRALVVAEDARLLARQAAFVQTIDLYRALGGGWEPIGLDGSMSEVAATEESNR